MAKLYGNINKTAEEIAAIVIEEFGEALGKAAQEVAAYDFDMFSGAVHSLGYESPDNDRNDYCNAVLVLRYPFLKSFNDSGWHSENYTPFGWTYLNDMPVGWQKAFALELCEDLRTWLEHNPNPEAAFRGYAVEQVKEKYGDLRWYDSFCDPSDDEDKRYSRTQSSLIELYNSLSSVTCATCGSFADVRISRGGWIIPECVKCRIDGDNRIEKQNWKLEWAKEHGFTGDFVPYRLGRLIERMQLRASSFPTNSIRVKDSTMGSYNNGVREEHNIYEDVLGHGFLVCDLVDERDGACPYFDKDKDPLPSEEEAIEAIRRYQKQQNEQD